MCKSPAVRLPLILTTTLLIGWFSAESWALQSFPKLCDVRDFEDFLQQTGKVYTDPVERQFRESIFTAQKAFVDMGNKHADAGVIGFRMSLNPLADLTVAETNKLLGSKLSVKGEELTSNHINFVTAPGSNGLDDGLPDSFDWREKGGVTPVGSQGDDCGSCWAFSAIGALEGHLFRRTGVLVPLSQQHLVDCADDYGCMGCEGGLQDYGFEYIRDHGVTLANKYPYVQTETACRQNETTGSVIKIRDYARIKPKDEQKMKEVIATLGPLACSINAATISFGQYSGGILDDNACNLEDVNHSIVVVGYGSENGRDYWIVKNSYSQNWGENGFFRLLRNADSFCGIANECSYPIL